MSPFPLAVVRFAMNRAPFPIDQGLQRIILHQLGYDLKVCAMMMQINQILVHIIVENELRFLHCHRLIP